MRDKILKMIERNKTNQDIIWKVLIRNAEKENSTMVKDNLEKLRRMENKEDILSNLL